MKFRYVMMALLLLAARGAGGASGPLVETTMTFTSLPITEDLRTTAHKILPYRTRDRIIVIVVDPIMCEQRPIDPRFEVKEDVIVLRYDLTPSPAGARQGCTAHSVFDLKDVPRGEFRVDFQGGNERVRSARVTRCPGAEPVTDVWDCVSSTAHQQAAMTFTSIPTIGDDVGTIKHDVRAFQDRDRVIAIIVDPIICGQRPINARFEIQGRKIYLSYDLTPVSLRARLGCTAHSLFDLRDVPADDVEVLFRGRDERLQTARASHCPGREAVADVWDCIVSPP